MIGARYANDFKLGDTCSAQIMNEIINEIGFNHLIFGFFDSHFEKGEFLIIGMKRCASGVMLAPCGPHPYYPFLEERAILEVIEAREWG